LFYTINDRIPPTNQPTTGNADITSTQAIDGSTVENETNVPQQWTDPMVNAADHTRPAMGFSDVGVVTKTETDSTGPKPKSVGHFESTKLLERPVKVADWNWSSNDPAMENLPLQSFHDIDKFLREFPRNKEILDQFIYYRTDIELTVRLNTNQFYMGGLMITMFPTSIIGGTIDARAVLQPTILDASSAQQVTKNWKWSWPMAWKCIRGGQTTAADQFPVSFYIDVLSPLVLTKSNLCDNIQVQIWANFKNIELAFPFPLPPAELRAKRGGVPQMQRSPSTDPAQKRQPPKPSVGSFLKTALMDTAEAGIDTLGDIATSLIPFDKADREETQSPFIMEASTDMYVTDIPDSNVSTSIRSRLYARPSPSRMPAGENFTVSRYARIPGIRAYKSYVTKGDNFQAPIITFGHEDALRTPLDYCAATSLMWRGSVKLMLQFFCAAFTSARFTLTYSNPIDANAATITADQYPETISKVINVKGPTIDCTTLPWLNMNLWQDTLELTTIPNEFTLTLQTPIVCSECASDTPINVVFWVAGGEDIQFAYPIVANETTWPVKPLPANARIKRGGTPQCSIADTFAERFPPLVENCHYMVDHDYATAEVLGAITDIAKRYSPMAIGDLDTYGFYAPSMDIMPIDIHDSAQAATQRYMKFRGTLFGTWRAAFLNRSGGYRYRRFYPLDYDDRDTVVVGPGSTDAPSTEPVVYFSAADRTTRVTVPQLLPNPFAVLAFSNAFITYNEQQLNLYSQEPGGSPPTVAAFPFIAARDDLQFGYPILPVGVPNPQTLTSLSDPPKDPIPPASVRLSCDIHPKASGVLKCARRPKGM